MKGKSSFATWVCPFRVKKVRRVGCPGYERPPYVFCGLSGPNRSSIDWWRRAKTDMVSGSRETMACLLNRSRCLCPGED